MLHTLASFSSRYPRWEHLDAYNYNHLQVAVAGLGKEEGMIMLSKVERILWSDIVSKSNFLLQPT